MHVFEYQIPRIEKLKPKSYFCDPSGKVEWVAETSNQDAIITVSIYNYEKPLWWYLHYQPRRSFVKAVQYSDVETLKKQLIENNFDWLAMWVYTVETIIRFDDLKPSEALEYISVRNRIYIYNHLREKEIELFGEQRSIRNNFYVIKPMEV